MYASPYDEFQVRLVRKIIDSLRESGFIIAPTSESALLLDAQKFFSQNIQESTRLREDRVLADEVKAYVDFAKQSALKEHKRLLFDAEIVEMVRANCGPKHWGC